MKKSICCACVGAKKGIKTRVAIPHTCDKGLPPYECYEVKKIGKTFYRVD